MTKTEMMVCPVCSHPAPLRPDAITPSVMVFDEHGNGRDGCAGTGQVARRPNPEMVAEAHAIAATMPSLVAACEQGDPDGVVQLVERIKAGLATIERLSQRKGPKAPRALLPIASHPVALAIAEFEHVQNTNEGYGCWDTEPDGVFQSLIRRAVQGKPFPPTMDAGTWQIYRKSGSNEVARKLTEAARKVYDAICTTATPDVVRHLKAYCWRLDLDHDVAGL